MLHLSLTSLFTYKFIFFKSHILLLSYYVSMCTYLCMNVCVYIYTQIVKIKLGYIIIIYYIWAIRPENNQNLERQLFSQTHT